MAPAALNVLREGDERFGLLVESVRDYAIFMLDPEGRVVSWNPGAERTNGYRRDEILGCHFTIFNTQEDQRAGRPGRELERARAAGCARDEGWRVRKDGSRFWAHVTLTPIEDAAGTFVGFSVVTRDETLRRHSEELEEASRRMEEFLALLAHELRNPLAPIRNAAAIMRLQPLDDPNLAWSRDVIDRQARHLTHLVDGLLDVSRFTTGKILLVREPLALGDVLRQAVEASQPAVEVRRQVLKVAIPEEPLRVDGDPVRLVQVVSSLLDNATKFTPEGGHIRLSAGREGSDAVIRVSDSGIGMSAELLPRVFDLFRQGGDSRGHSESGLGVGLTLARGLVEMHGGSIEAQCAGPGRGSTFVVRLPGLVESGVAPASP